MFLLLMSSTLEQTLPKQISCEIYTNAHHKKGSEEHLHQGWDIYYFKTKVILFIVNLRWNIVIRYGQVQVQKQGFCNSIIWFI